MDDFCGSFAPGGGPGMVADFWSDLRGPEVDF